MDSSRTHMAQNWRGLLIRGIAAILFGIAAISWPGLTVATLVLLFGFYILTDGILGVINAVQYRKITTHWLYWLLEGALGVIVGVLTLILPGTTAFILLVCVAIWAIMGGALRIVTAVRLGKQIKGTWILFVSGLLSVAFGFAIVALPHAGLVSIAWIIGFWAVAFGTVFVLLALRLRRVGA